MKQSGLEGAKDVPSYARGAKPQEKAPGTWETPDDFATRLMDKQWGEGSWRNVPERMDEFRKIKKSYRHWQRPPTAPPLDPGVSNDSIA